MSAYGSGFLGAQTFGRHVGRVPTINALGVLGASGPLLVWVETVEDFFRLQSGGTFVADGITVVAGADSTTWWIRTLTANPLNAQRLVWAIDATSGDDQNPGWGTTEAEAKGRPLKTTAEFRRRMWNCTLTQNVTVYPIGDFPNDLDYGRLYGFQCAPNIIVAFVGTPTVVSSGTITAVQQISGNDRYEISDAGRANWIGNVSGSSGSFMVRRTNSASCRAMIMKDMGIALGGDATAMIGQPIAVSDTPAMFPAVTAVDFAPGDTYEVVSFQKVPPMSCDRTINFRYYFLDGRASGYRGGWESPMRAVLCGNVTNTGLAGALVTYGCIQSFGQFAVAQQSTFLSVHGCWLGKLENQGSNVLNNGQSNYSASPNNNSLETNTGGSTRAGNWYVWDRPSVCVEAHGAGSRVELDSLRGDGNTWRLIVVNGMSQVYAPSVTAVTTDPTPYQVQSGAAATIPLLDTAAGSFIYA